MSDDLGSESSDQIILLLPYLDFVVAVLLDQSKYFVAEDELADGKIADKVWLDK